MILMRGGAHAAVPAIAMLMKLVATLGGVPSGQVSLLATWATAASPDTARKSADKAL
jgi:hypothetical protein